MAENAEETNPTTEETQAPTRRRASRRATAAAGTVTAAKETSAEAAADAAPAAEAPVESSAEETPKKRVSRGRKKAVDAEAGTAEKAAGETAAAEESAPDSKTTKAAAAKTTTARASGRASAAKTAAGAQEADAAQAPAAEAASGDQPAEEAPKKRATRTRKKSTGDAAQTPAADATEATSENADAESQSAEATEQPKSAPARRRATRKAAVEQATSAQEPTEADSQVEGAESAAASAGIADGESARAAQSADETTTGATDDTANGRGRGRRTRRGGAEPDANAEAAADESTDEESSRSRSRGRGNSRGQDNGKADSTDGNGDRSGRSDGQRSDAQRSDQQSRSSRTRQRDRKRRGQGDDFEQEITEDDVLLPIAGILDVLDNYAFVRTSGYLPGSSDVYVSLGQVKKYGLRKGDAVVGAIRQPRENDGGGRQKYNAIVKVDSINGRPADDQATRGDFAELTPLYPQERLPLETSGVSAVARAIDLITPIGKGQRGLIIGERGTGTSEVLRTIAASVGANAPDAHLIAVLIDERPEEVTDLQRQIKGEVVASTFDRAAEDHTTIAELAIERAKRLVELGHDVVVLLDSVTALGRAYAQRPVQGRPAAAPVDAVALQPLKSLLAAAGNIENGGSLTIIATAHEKTGSRTDKVILRELAGTANMELRLSADLAEKGLEPAIDIAKSYTVRAEQLLGEAEKQASRRLRAQLTEEDDDDALKALLKKISTTATNATLLSGVARG